MQKYQSWVKALAINFSAHTRPGPKILTKGPKMNFLVQDVIQTYLQGLYIHISFEQTWLGFLQSSDEEYVGE